VKTWGEIKEKGSDGPSAAVGVVEREVWFEDMVFDFAGNVSVIQPLI